MNSTTQTIGRNGKAITNTTCLFRHYEYAFKPYAERILPDLVARVRNPIVLSAPCSTGQEAHSIAAVNHRFGASHINVEGVDISRDVIEVAKGGRYDVADFWFASFAIPGGYSEFVFPDGKVNKLVMNRFLKPFTQFRIADKVRETTNFSVGDLVNGTLQKEYDAIFSMNFLTLLNDEDMKKALDNLILHLKVGGYIILNNFERNVYGGTDATCDLDPEDNRLVSVGKYPERIYQKQ